MLAKRCAGYFGQSPTQLIQERLIQVAKDQLYQTNLSIKEIASKLQFNDEFYFSRLFKKKVNVSPRQFRNNLNP